MSPTSECRDDVISSIPRPVTDQMPTYTTEPDRISNAGSSRSGSTSEAEGTSRNGLKAQRPKLHTRKSSGTIIIPRDAKQIEVHDEEYDEGDARTMSPRRSSEEVDRLEQGLRENMIEYVSVQLVTCPSHS